jgi:hypothetical protein
VLGCKGEGEPLLTLALDRIVDLAPADELFAACPSPRTARYFRHVIGVTVSAGQEPVDVQLFVHGDAAPYVLTKPLHHSQRVVETNAHGTVISLRVQHNYELEREILGFGDRVKVLAPERLRRCIREALVNALDQYQYETHNTNLQSQLKKLDTGARPCSGTCTRARRSNTYGPCWAGTRSPPARRRPNPSTPSATCWAWCRASKTCSSTRT